MSMNLNKGLVEKHLSRLTPSLIHAGAFIKLARLAVSNSGTKRMLILAWGLMLMSFPHKGHGQEAWPLPSGLILSGGLKVDLGFPINRIGMLLQASYTWDFVTLNGLLAGQYQFSHLGPRPMQPGWEWQTGLGAVVGWGPPRQDTHPFQHLVANQTGRFYALGYAWKYYRDPMQTSQLTGLLGLNFGPWEILSENDAYTGLVYDRYRTGGVSVAYRHHSFRFTVFNTLWTGDPYQQPRVKDSDYPARYGYKDLSRAPYGHFSHGILGVQVMAALPYYHLGQVSLGIDAEQIRNFVQNRMIHDMYFLPKNWTQVRNAHYPMLDQQGEPFLYQPEQQVRRPRPYFSLGLNPTLFY